MIRPLLRPKRDRWARPAGNNQLFLNGMLHVLRKGCLGRDKHGRCDKWNLVSVRSWRWVEQGVWDALLLRMLCEQEDCCVITGMPLGYVGETDDLQMCPSLDRIDSRGYYTPGNVKIVCHFINCWKNSDPDDLVRRWLGVLRDHHRVDICNRLQGEGRAGSHARLAQDAEEGIRPWVFGS